MARNGSFDPHLEPRAWWDEQAVPEGWFDADLIGDASAPPAIDVQVSQVWLGTPNNRDAAASQTVGAFGTSATGEVYVSGAAAQNVGAFGSAATGDFGAGGGTVDASAAQSVNAFVTAAAAENDSPVIEAAPARKRGGGAPRETRRIVVRIDDDVFIVDTPAEARALIAQAEALAEDAARAKAKELAAREQVRMRAARRAAPVVRIESPEPVPEIEAIREQVDAVNARIQALYVQALQTALIAREMQRRIEEDEEDAITALLA